MGIDKVQANRSAKKRSSISEVPAKVIQVKKLYYFTIFQPDFIPVNY
jgi:hypothetical protein